jgi:hypothetical protein
MSTIRSDIPPAIAFLSVVFHQSMDMNYLINLIQAHLFEVGRKFEPEYNPSLDYYAKQMLCPLKRIILVGAKPVNRDALIDLKLKADQLERSHLIDKKRQVNLDPGLITLEQVILATGKPYNHRVYLGQGVFSDLVYIFENGSFTSLAWTYPDYQEPAKIIFFNQIRSEFKKHLTWNDQSSL